MKMIKQKARTYLFGIQNTLTIPPTALNFSRCLDKHFPRALHVFIHRTEPWNHHHSLSLSHILYISRPWGRPSHARLVQPWLWWRFRPRVSSARKQKASRRRRRRILRRKPTVDGRAGNRPEIRDKEEGRKKGSYRVFSGKDESWVMFTERMCVARRLFRAYAVPS